LSRKLIAAIAILSIFAAGCAVRSSTPGPEAQAAAKRISTDISHYRKPEAKAEKRGDAADLVHGANLFALVYDQVRSNYVRQVDDETLIAAATKGIRKRHPNPKKAKDQELIEAAIQGMLTSLDSYSTYLDGRQLKALRDQTRGSFGGLGIEVRKGKQYIEVVTPIDDTPAARAGLKPNDMIVRADNRSMKDMTLREAVLLLRGPPDSDVKLRIKRGKKPVFDVVVTRAIIKVAAVRWRTEKQVGYLRITSFSEHASEEVANALLAIRGKLGNRLQGFVVDLRNNPGGLLKQSIKISDMFLQKGRIVSIRERNNEHHENASKGDLAQGLPIVVLINKGSASAAEIVAGALKDNRRATLVGTRSFGKGTVQTIIPLSRRDAVKLTTAIYLTPSGGTVEGGIHPDYSVKLDDKRKGDEQLQRAIQLLNKRTAHRSRDVRTH
jgi:carboxyl-terminal processing protease